MIITKTILIWLNVFIATFHTSSGATLTDDSGEDFLKAVIDRLKEEKFDDNGSPLEALLGHMRRSVDDYKGDNSPATLENTLDQQNSQSGLDQPNNQVVGLYTLANLKPWDNYHQFNENPYNSEGVQNSPQEPDLSAHNLEAYAAGLNPSQNNNLPVHNLEAYAAGLNTPQNVNLPAQNLEAYASGLNTFGVLGANDPLHQFNNFVGAAVNDQFQTQNNALVNEVAQNSEPLAIPTYYFNPADNSIDDNLLDEAINAMKSPYDQLGQESNKKYVVEPLFVAMAGFVGIAMIFMSAVLFLPKLVTPHPQVNGLRAPQELAALTKLAVEAMDGNDCTERIACEVGRAMRSMQVGMQPIKMIEVILPVGMAKQLAQIRKAVASEQTCKLIQCKKMASTPQLKVNKKATAELKINANLNSGTKKNENKPEPKKS